MPSFSYIYLYILLRYPEREMNCACKYIEVGGGQILMGISDQL